MSTLAAAHLDEIKRLEAAHTEELRHARQGHGFRDELVLGLHKSYGKQIESLVVDLNDAQRQLKSQAPPQPQLQPQPPQPPVTTTTPQDDARRLPMVLRFDDLDKAFSVAEISTPHPGRSFSAVWKHLSHAVKTYVATLNTAAEFFAGPNAAEARRIRHWHAAACEERIHFRFLHGADGDNMSELWERELWRKDTFTLRVLCAAEPPGWEGVPVFDDEQLGTATAAAAAADPQRALPKPKLKRTRARTPLGPALEGVLVQVAQTPRTTDAFNVAAALENINRELRELETGDGLTELGDEDEDDENKENIERPIPKRKATVEEVTDEEDHLHDDPDEGVGLAISSSPTMTEKEPLLRGKKTTPLGDRGYLESLLGEQEEERKTSAGSSGSDSWLFDDLFSPLPVDKGKGKGKEKVVGLFESMSLPLSPRVVGHAYLQMTAREQDARDHIGGSKPAWKWMLTSDGIIKTPPGPLRDTHTLKMAQQYFKEASGGGPWLERLMEEEGEDDNTLNSENDQPDISEHEDTIVPEKKDRPFFSFGEEATTSPAPPPAPEVRKSPGLPAYLRAEIESSSGARLDSEDSDIDDNQPRDGGDPENPFADLKPGQCDTPVMGTSRSAASNTPLLRDGSPAPRNRSGPGLKISTESQKPSRGLSDPFQPMPKPPKFNLPKQQQQPVPRYRGYGFQNVDRDDDDDDDDRTIDRWETGSDASGTTIEGVWESRHQRKCGRGKGPEAYMWRHDQDREAASFRSSRSVSPPLPPPSRSSITTTADRRHSDFVLPAPAYPLNAAAYPLCSSGNNSSSNLAPRYGSMGMMNNMGMNMNMRSMGPLGPQGGHHSTMLTHTHSPYSAQQQADLAFHQQQMKKLSEHKMNELFAANYGVAQPMRSSGPVYAPNPPHSAAPVSAVAPDGAVGWPMRPMLMQPHMVSWTSNGGISGIGGGIGEPRRSRSTDSISPLLWRVDDQQAQQQAQVQAQQQQQMVVPSRPQSTMGMGMMGMGMGMGMMGMEQQPWAYAAQPGTPGSGALPPPGWFAQQQQQQQQGVQQGQGSFEGMWTGSPCGMPPHWSGTFGG